jgi:DNA-directed RNA polymerase III subunit RPC4
MLLTAATPKTYAHQPGTVAKVASAATTSQGEGTLQRGSQASGTTYGHSSAAPYRDEQARVNTDLLDSFTQEFYIEGTTASSGGSGKRKKQLMPMGLLRHDHQSLDSRALAEKAERDATEDAQVRAESEESDLYMDDPNKLHVNDVGMQNDTKVWGDVPKRRRSVRIKTEDAHTSNPADLISIPPAAVEPALSPQARKHHVKQADQSLIPGPPVEHHDDLEDNFIAADLDKMRKGLGRAAVGSPVGEHSLDNKLFLFQFPPILPPLRRKDDVYDAEADGNHLVTSSALQTQATLGAEAISIDDRMPMKIEDSDKEPLSATATALRDLIGDGGYVGQLNVRQSGKVELSWGGRILEMMPGDEQLSLITAVITEQRPGNAVPLQNETAGKAYGMGRIEGKFVLAPALEEEEEWKVDPEGLLVR